MDQLESLSHSVWECKYHVAFIPKCRRKVLYESLRQHLGEVFKRLAEQKECRVLEGHLMPDHAHMLLSIPPKYAVSEVVGFIKGKSAIHLARTYGEHKQNFAGQHFWARGYFVSTVGRDETAIRDYIRNQEVEDKRLDQLKMWKKPPKGGPNNVGAALATPLKPLRAAHTIKPPAMPGVLTGITEQVIRSSGNVFADMGLPDAAELDTKARLGAALHLIVERQLLTQAEVATVLGINQPKVSALLHYKLEGFSVERLMHFLVALGQDVEIVVKSKPRSRSARIAVKAA